MQGIRGYVIGIPSFQHLLLPIDLYFEHAALYMRDLRMGMFVQRSDPPGLEHYFYQHELFVIRHDLSFNTTLHFFPWSMLIFNEVLIQTVYLHKYVLMFLMGKQGIQRNLCKRNGQQRIRYGHAFAGQQRLWQPSQTDQVIAAMSFHT